MTGLQESGSYLRMQEKQTYVWHLEHQLDVIDLCASSLLLYIESTTKMYNNASALFVFCLFIFTDKFKIVLKSLSCPVFIAANCVVHLYNNMMK